jgi:hypothetical protein
MRMFALAAAIGAGLAVGGVASAEQWNDPNGRLTFNAPSGWRVQLRNATDQTIVLAFNPTNDCYFFGLPNPNTATATASQARNATTPLPADAWVTAAGPIRDFFEGSTPVLVSQTVDTSGFWPAQRAELRGPTKTVYGAILTRPGFEIRAFCAGSNSVATYDSIFASLGHPNDATWQAQANEQAAARAAQEQAAQQQSEQQQPSEDNDRRRRRNRD